ncbi:MAG: hypothetical protein K2Q12_00945 [Rickettsiales bacterium]|nr:hypothetical protein [Rickettsiales bacterium]
MKPNDNPEQAGAQKANESVEAQPQGLVQIGAVALGEKPRKPSLLSFSLNVIGYAATFISASFVRLFVSDLAKENASAYEVAASDTFLSSINKGLRSQLDKNLWKSNLAAAATGLGGYLLTNYAVKKLEQHTFKKHHGEPSLSQLENIIKGQVRKEIRGNFDEVEEKPKTNWQEKTKKTEEPQQGPAL